MKLSVVILNYNVHYFLQLCLSSVEAAIKGLEAEIIVVDNNSSDESCKMVKLFFPNVKLIENKENLGFSKGNNIGVNAAKGDFVCILNPDTVVAEDTFTKLIQFTEHKTDIGIVGCKLVDGRGRFLPESKRNVPVLKVAFKKQIGDSRSYYAEHLQEDQSGEVSILVGAFMFMRRSLYKELDGFDEDFFMYGEDIDLSYRALKKGYKNYYFSETTVIHFKGESTLKDKHYAKNFFGAMKIFYKKHFKGNRLNDLFVWLGVKLAYLFSSPIRENVKTVDQYVLIGDEHNELNKVLSKPLLTFNKPETISENSELILNANTLSYKEVISYYVNSNLNSVATFKILPKKANFIIGSNSSKTRGETINF